MWPWRLRRAKICYLQAGSQGKRVVEFQSKPKLLRSQGWGGVGAMVYQLEPEGRRTTEGRTGFKGRRR